MIVLVSGSIYFLSAERDFSTNHTAGNWNVEGAWVCMTVGFVWAELILVLAHLRYEILVFVSAVWKIAMKLIPFYLIMIMTMFAYGNMLFVANLIEEPGNTCEGTRRNGLDNQVMCTRQESYYAVLAMFLEGTCYIGKTFKSVFISHQIKFIFFSTIYST